jgi:hypothetical protein
MIHMPASMVVRTGVNKAPNQDLVADARMKRSTHRVVARRVRQTLVKMREHPPRSTRHVLIYVNVSFTSFDRSAARCANAQQDKLAPMPVQCCRTHALCLAPLADASAGRGSRATARDDSAQLRCGDRHQWWEVFSLRGRNQLIAAIAAINQSVALAT